MGRISCSRREFRLAALVLSLVIGFVASGANDLLFIHHSVGQNWLDSGLRTALDAKSYVNNVNDIYYGTTASPDAGRPESLGAVPGDNTDMNYWVLWFNDYFQTIRTQGGGFNQIVMFKSCFPNSNIESDGTDPGDPFSFDKTLTNYKAVYRHPNGSGNTYTYNGYTYRPLEDIFAAHPDILFIPVTAPPLCYGAAETTDENAHRARLFNNWLKTQWLPSYTAAHPTSRNVAVFDFFNILAYADNASNHPNRLKQEYGGATHDSHPNNIANAFCTQVFATNDLSFIDVAWTAFNTHVATLTMAASPLAGGTTIPIVGSTTVVDPDSPVNISATPADGYTFTSWTGTENVTIANPFAAATTASVSSGVGIATANFATAGLALTMAVSPTEGGTTLPPAGSSTVVEPDSPVTIVATPALGYTFTSWTGTENVTIANPNAATTTASLSGGNGSATANFTASIQYTVRFSARTGGSIEGEAIQTVNPGASCSPVTAVPAAGYHFYCWNGGPSPQTDNPVTISNVQSNLNIFAVFVRDDFAPTLATSPVGYIPGSNFTFVVALNYSGSDVFANANMTVELPNGWGDTYLDTDRIIGKPVSVHFAPNTHTLSVVWSALGESTDPRSGSMSFTVSVPSDFTGNGLAVMAATYNETVAGAIPNPRLIPPRSYHSADYNPADWRIDIFELLRVVTLFNNGLYYKPDLAGPDGYAASAASVSFANAAAHSADYNPEDGRIDINELSRVITLFNNGLYYRIDNAGADGYAPSATQP